MQLLQALVLIGSFVTIWYGSGLIVSSANKFAKKVRISSFAFSFLVLGLLTSTPEFAVGITAVSENTPEIFIGNLIGGIPVLFLFVIPILAVLGKGISLKGRIEPRNLMVSFAVMLLPAFFVIDRVVTNLEAGIMIGAYLGLLYAIQRRHGMLDAEHSDILNTKSYSIKDILKIIYGVGLVFVASHYIVNGTQYFASQFDISTFVISLVLLSIGTNLPELSLTIRSVVTGNKDVAFGDYIGSGAANTLLFGVFTIMTNGNVLTTNHFLPAFLLIGGGLVLFYFFARSKNILSQKEGIALLSIYLLFLFLELS